eukprot:306306-Rhodomonas_salina.1
MKAQLWYRLYGDMRVSPLISPSGPAYLHFPLLAVPLAPTLRQHPPAYASSVPRVVVLAAGWHTLSQYRTSHSSTLHSTAPPSLVPYLSTALHCIRFLSTAQPAPPAMPVSTLICPVFLPSSGSNPSATT